MSKSLSSRRAWIEIKILTDWTRHGMSLSSRRAWIEMNLAKTADRQLVSRSPHGERGLKCLCKRKSVGL